MKKHLIITVLLLVSFLFISCGEEASVSENSVSNVPLKINVTFPDEVQSGNTDLTTAQLEDFLEFVTTVRVIVQGNFPTITQTFSRGDQIVVFVPPGNNITFIVSLLNAQGQAICSGQTTTDIIPGIANEITVSCEVNDEVCDNNQDDNGNGQVDCAEDSCAGSECDETNSNICIDNQCVPLPEVESDCGDGIDDDQDGQTDCSDSDCSNDEACIETVCDDGVDNDSDGDIDCDDLDCSENSVCDEVCNNMEDDDNDGDTDCADNECDNQNCDANDEDFVCVEGVCEDTGGETDCDNGIDDDGDELTDCDDLEDCEGRICFSGDEGSACVTVQGEGGPFGECQEVICSDGINNDNDTDFQEPATDCNDLDCVGEPCGVGFGAECGFGEGGFCFETNCFDGIDNDDEGEGAVDCNDFFCWNNNSPCGTGQGGQGAECQFNGEGGTCTEIACSNGNDDDNDGDTDCDDGDCEGDPSCMICNSSCSLDGDMIFDDECEGMECNGSGTSCEFVDGLLCIESDCTDGLDNDGFDGADCQDFSCNGELGPQGQVCESNGEITCDDGFDNDGDGDIDNADFDCSA